MEFVGTMKMQGYRLMVGDCDVVETVKNFGTPLMIYDQAGIEERARVFRETFRSNKFATNIIYASKALSILYLIGLIDELDLHLDVVSGGELHVAKRANFPLEKVYFHGNNKSFAELKMALELGVGTIVVDHPGELELLVSLLEAFKGRVVQRVLLRVNPGIKAKTHKYIQTTTEESKFGMGTGDPVTHELIQTMIDSPYLDFAGFHCHIGSQILQEEFFLEEARAILEFTRHIELEHGCRIREVNLGGGFGVQYNADDVTLDYRSFLKKYVATVEELQEDLGLELETVSIEPGRSLVNPFGSTIYEVGGVKVLPSGLNYVFVDGGMTDNPRPALYEAKYEARVLKTHGSSGSQGSQGSQESSESQRPHESQESHEPHEPQGSHEAQEPQEPKTYRIAGKCCETGDVLIQEQELTDVQTGDLLLVHGTGAYTYSMSSNYNHLPRPAVVFLKDGEAKLAVRRETYEDLIARDEVYRA